MSAPYMPLFVGDYLADTQHLTAAEHGAYLLLIMTYWQREKPLPDDDRKLARIARLGDDEWAAARETLAEFFEARDGLWLHGRIERELEVIADKREKARAAGRASANARSTSAQRSFSERSTDAQPSQTRPEYRPTAPDAGAQASASTGDPPGDLEAECRAILGGKAPPSREPRDSDFPMLDGFERVDVLAACRDWAADPTAQALRRWKPLTGWVRAARDGRLKSAAMVAGAGRAGRRAPPPTRAKHTVLSGMIELARERAERGEPVET